jgi:hypothetical protein
MLRAGLACGRSGIRLGQTFTPAILFKSTTTFAGSVQLRTLAGGSQSKRHRDRDQNGSVIAFRNRPERKRQRLPIEATNADRQIAIRGVGHYHHMTGHIFQPLSSIPAFHASASSNSFIWQSWNCERRSSVPTIKRNSHPRGCVAMVHRARLWVLRSDQSSASSSEWPLQRC